MTRLIDADALLEVIKADRYTNAQDAIFFITNAPTVQQSEPFGYFKAEPFGWTDCAETDEGAIALYEAPTVQREGWVSVEDRLPDQLELKIKLIDGSEIYAWYQSDGDYYWNCGGREIFIDESNVTHWQPLPVAPTDTE